MVAKLTETGGWVNGVTHHHSPNYEWGMSVPAGVNGTVMHTMVGYLSSADNEFMSSAAQVSAHFGIGSDGSIIQWVAINGGVAWAECAGNYNWYSIEHEDRGDPHNPLTAAQITSSARLLELTSRIGNFPLQEANSTSAEGYGVHYMGGAAWGGHSCPDVGHPVRSLQRPAIIALAKEISGGSPTPPTHDWSWTSDYLYSLADIAASHHTNPAVIIGTTAVHVSFDSHLSWYINAQNWTGHLPKGVKIFYEDGGVKSWVSDGQDSLQTIASSRKTTVSRILYLTAINNPKTDIIPGNLGGYLNSVNWDGLLSRGSVIWIPAGH